MADLWRVVFFCVGLQENLTRTPDLRGLSTLKNHRWSWPYGHKSSLFDLYDMQRPRLASWLSYSLRYERNSLPTVIACGFTNVWEQHTNWENPIGFIQQRAMCPNSLWPHMLSAEHIFSVSIRCANFVRYPKKQYISTGETLKKNVLYCTEMFTFSHGFIGFSL